jgi:hypothetical protein
MDAEIFIKEEYNVKRLGVAHMPFFEYEEATLYIRLGLAAVLDPWFRPPVSVHGS